MVILLVTWIIFGQPPTSYQVQFSDQAACDAARDKILGEAVTLRLQELQRDADIEEKLKATGGLHMPSEPPRVVVVCAKK